tara:strand:+ start:1581 stop:2711 length:1131 start_codon:yes stop_codon:yes gene_type:complete
MSYSIDNIVASEIVLKPSGLSSVDFQKAFLYVTNSEVPESLSDSVGTYKTYTTISQMTADGFTDDSEPVKAAQAWLGGVPAMSNIIVYLASDTGSITEQVDALDVSFFWFFMTKDMYTETNVLSVAPWADTRQVFFMSLVNGASVEDARNKDKSDDIVSKLNGLGYRLTASFVSAVSPYAGIALCKWFASVDYNAPSSTITGEYKKLSGIIAESLTPDEITAQTNKKAIWYGTAENAGQKDVGRVFNSKSHSSYDEFMDSVVDSVVMGSFLQTGIYNNLVNQTNKLPFTPQGYQQGIERAKSALEIFVRNGYLGEREYQNAVGETKLSRGYDILSQASDILKATDDQRANREPPAIVYQFFPAGSIHKFRATGRMS